MKAFALILLALSVSNVRAESWVETKCSNSDGTVKWQSGSEDQDQIHLKYSNFVAGTLSLDINKVSIQFSKDVTLNQRSFNTCQTMGQGRVYAGKVKIVAADKHPDVLRSYFPENKVQTEVICTTVVMEPSECANN